MLSIWVVNTRVRGFLFDGGVDSREVWDCRGLGFGSMMGRVRRAFDVCGVFFIGWSKVRASLGCCCGVGLIILSSSIRIMGRVM